MKISIIGYGFVGQALKGVLNDHEPFPTIIDPKYSGTTIDTEFNAVFSSDVIFLCLPTPTVNGHCDDSLIIDHIKKLNNYPGCLIIKSTIPPSTVEKILKIRPTTVIWPELLREQYSQHDMQFPKMIVIGAPSDLQFQYVANFIKKYTHISWGDPPRGPDKIQQTTPIGASLFKYAVNSFLATKVVFFHQMYKWVSARGNAEEYEEMVRLLSREPRIGESHLVAPGTHGLGYSGSCFPKDVEALLGQIYEDDKLTFPLLDVVATQNSKLRTENLK